MDLLEAHGRLAALVEVGAQLLGGDVEQGRPGRRWQQWQSPGLHHKGSHRGNRAGSYEHSTWTGQRLGRGEKTSRRFAAADLKRSLLPARFLASNLPVRKARPRAPATPPCPPGTVRES